MSSNDRGPKRESWLFSQFVRHRRPFQMGIDATAWAVAVPVASFLRHDFDAGSLRVGHLVLYVVLAWAVQGAVGMSEGLYRGRFSFGSFEEVAALARTSVVVTAIGAAVNQLAFPDRLPSSVPFIALFFALTLMCAFRYGWRLALDRHRRPSAERAEPTIVFGAGEGGQQVVTSMLRDPDSPYLPVALLDDDPAKARLELRGVPVVGDRQAMAHAAARFRATSLVIAVPSAPAELIRDLAERAGEAGLAVKVLPPVGELLGDALSVGDIRPLSERDLLGRHEVKTDLDAIAGYLTGKRVLVTGAGGSIGSELCRQIHRFAPAALVMLDRDESALHAVQLSIEGRALLDDGSLVVADIRDEARMHEVFAEHRPQVVFHAAALKHLPLLELHPEEGVKTNVFGSLNVLRAAQRIRVERFVNISTDKAADPTSMLGYTKRIAERLTAAIADDSADGTYLSVRFGNVLGSRGSVLTAFRAQLDAGGPITVTHPEVTRYFMTVEEAVQLVIQAGAVGRDGEALILDMGEPVRIADVAKRMIEASGKRIEIQYTGLRPGEKLHEVLRAEDEPDHRPFHELISHVPVPPLDPAAVDLPPSTLAAQAAELYRAGLRHPSFEPSSRGDS